MGLATPTLEIGALLLTAFLYGAWKFYGFLHIVYLTPLSDLPGPPSSSWVYGNMRDIAAVDENLLPDTWFTRYGKNLIDREFFMVRQYLVSFSSFPHSHAFSAAACVVARSTGHPTRFVPSQRLSQDRRTTAESSRSPGGRYVAPPKCVQ